MMMKLFLVFLFFVTFCFSVPISLSTNQEDFISHEDDDIEKQLMKQIVEENVKDQIVLQTERKNNTQKDLPVALGIEVENQKNILLNKQKEKQQQQEEDDEEESDVDGLGVENSDICNQKYKSETTCKSDNNNNNTNNCVWCTSVEIPSACYEQKNAEKLPSSVFSCQQQGQPAQQQIQPQQLQPQQVQPQQVQPQQIQPQQIQQHNTLKENEIGMKTYQKIHRSCQRLNSSEICEKQSECTWCISVTNPSICVSNNEIKSIPTSVFICDAFHTSQQIMSSLLFSLSPPHNYCAPKNYNEIIYLSSLFIYELQEENGDTIENALHHLADLIVYLSQCSDYDLTEEIRSNIEFSLNILRNPKQIYYNAGNEIKINGIELYNEITDLIKSKELNDFVLFGRNIGNIIKKIFNSLKNNKEKINLTKNENLKSVSSSSNSNNNNEEKKKEVSEILDQNLLHISKESSNNQNKNDESSLSQQIVSEALEGIFDMAIANFDIPPISECISKEKSEIILTHLNTAIDLLSQDQLVNYLSGLEEFSFIFKSLSEEISHCKKFSATHSRILLNLSKKLEDPHDVEYNEGRIFKINNTELRHDIVSAVGDWHRRMWGGFGFKFGIALAKLTQAGEVKILKEISRQRK